VSKEIIGYNNSDKNVYNSIGGVKSTSLNKIRFVKDPEKLLVQYDNLIRSLGKKYSKQFYNPSEVEDLFSYVKDAFVTLVKEYDINSEVDFAGYIKFTLEPRVHYSYTNMRISKSDRVTPLKANEYSVQDIINGKEYLGNSIATDKDNVVTSITNVSEYDDSLLILLDRMNSIIGLDAIDYAVIELLLMNIKGIKQMHDYTLETKGVNIPIKVLTASYNKIKEYFEEYYYPEVW